MAESFDTGGEDPRQVLARLVEEAQVVEDDDLSALGAGPLESLLFEHEEELWPEIEQLARQDPRFRRALRGVWAYDSPRFTDRDALLWELGEWTKIEVRFVGYRDDLAADSPLTDWRAFEAAGAPLEQVMDLLRRVVHGYDSGAWGPGHRDHPARGVKLFTSADLDPVRRVIEAALESAGLVLVPPADWESDQSVGGLPPGRHFSDVRLKVRRDPDEASDTMHMVRAALPGLVEAARGLSVADWGVRVVLSVALSDDRHVSYVFLVGGRYPTGLRHDQLAEAIVTMPDDLGQDAASYMWHGNGWYDGNRGDDTELS